MSALIDSNTEYKSVKVVNVDWDEFRGALVSDELGVTRQSTLVAFKDGEEAARVVGATGQEQLEALFIAVL